MVFCGSFLKSESISNATLLSLLSVKRGGSVRGVPLFEFGTPCKVAHHACLKPCEARRAKSETERASLYFALGTPKANYFPAKIWETTYDVAVILIVIYFF